MIWPCPGRADPARPKGENVLKIKKFKPKDVQRRGCKRKRKLVLNTKKNSEKSYVCISMCLCVCGCVCRCVGETMAKVMMFIKIKQANERKHKLKYIRSTKLQVMPAHPPLQLYIPLLFRTFGRGATLMIALRKLSSCNQLPDCSSLSAWSTRARAGPRPSAK